MAVVSASSLDEVDDPERKSEDDPVHAKDSAKPVDPRRLCTPQTREPENEPNVSIMTLGVFLLDLNKVS